MATKRATETENAATRTDMVNDARMQGTGVLMASDRSLPFSDSPVHGTTFRGSDQMRRIEKTEEHFGEGDFAIVSGEEE